MKRAKLILFILLNTIFYPFFAQPVNNLVQDVILPAPNAAALGKYVDIPVSHFTGIPNINIPIYTVQEGPLSLPVSLSYHASGIKVGETASWVGIGWSLNAGGMITRSVLGIPDELARGYAQYGNNISNKILNKTLTDIERSEITTGFTDSEPDIFTFNFVGYQGKFYIDANKTCHLVPQQDLKIAIDWGVEQIYSFTLTAPNGMKAYFGNLPGATDGKGIETSIPMGINPDNPNDEVSNTWYLLRIESPDNKYFIDLAYEDEYYSYNYLASCRHDVFHCQLANGGNVYKQISGGGIVERCGGNGDPQININLIRNNIHGKRISNISTSSGNSMMQFKVSELREDLDPTNTNSTYNAYSLDRIELHQNDSCKAWRFSYDYFEDVVYTNRSESKRLKLTALQETSCDLEVTIPPHQFTYYGSKNPGKESYFLPNRLSRQIDHWGFYNGAQANEYTNEINIPPTTVVVQESVIADGSNVAEEIGTITYGNSDRDTDPEKVKTGVLNKIQYPTGGVHEFDYEAHSYVKNGEEVTETDIITLTSCGEVESECFNPYAGCANALTTYEVLFANSEQIDSARLQINLRVPPNVVDNYPQNSFEWRRCFVDYTYNPEAEVPPYCYANGNVSINLQVIKVSDGSLVGQIGSNVNPDLNNLCSKLNLMLKELAIHQNFETGVTYRFILEVDNGLGEARLFTRFTEQNVPITHYVGGLRIKSFTAKASVDQAYFDKHKKYDYTSKDTDQSSGILFVEPVYGYNLNLHVGALNIFNIYYQDQSVVPLATFEGRHIGYSRVVEQEEGNGQNEYLFHIEEPSSPGQGSGNQFFPEIPPIATLENGNPKAIRTYSEQSEVPFSIKSFGSSTSYVEIPSEVIKIKKFPNVCSFDTQSPYPVNVPDFYVDQEYKPRTGVYLVETDTTHIDQIETITNYLYGSEDLFPRVITTTNSNGRIQEQRFKYPMDFDPTLKFGINSDNTTIQSLINKWMIGMPIETQTWEGSSGNLKMIGGQIQRYQNFGSGNDTILKPAEIYLLETTTPLAASEIYNDIDGEGRYIKLKPWEVADAYAPRAHFVYESTYGNLVEQSLEGGVPTSYLWGFNGNRPIAQVVGESYNAIQNTAIGQLRTSFPDALITTYEYNDRLQLAKILAPDGIKLHYNYDKLGRLTETQDDDNALLQLIQYNYHQ